MATLRTLAATASLLFVVGVAVAQPPAAPAAKAEFPELTDAVLKTLGIARSTIASDKKLQTHLADAVRQFQAGDGAAAWQSFQDAADLDAHLPNRETMLVRMLAKQQTTGAGKPPKFEDKSRTKLIQKLELRSSQTYDQSRSATGDERRERLQESLDYSRALVALTPDDPNYRFNVAFIAQELGDVKTAQAIMDKLAPRHSAGFAKAHIWQADQLLSPDRPLTGESLDDAEAHLLFALSTSSKPIEIHRRLGELFYFRYVRFRPQAGVDPAQRAVFLAKAAEHLEQVVAEEKDTKLRLTLAEIHGLQGKTRIAEQEVAAIIETSAKRLADVPNDLETRLSLARAHRMVREFDKAARVLQEGLALRPDVRLNQELSSILYFQMIELLNRRPDAFAEQFQILKESYRAYPANNYVTHRFVQALTSAKAEEAEAARTVLRELVDENAPGSLAPLLLAFDAKHQGRKEEADERLAKLRQTKPDGTTEVIAGLSMAVLSGQVKSLSPSAVSNLFEAAIDAWPDDPGLLSVRAQQKLLLRRYAEALGDLQKAIEKRPDDAKLHEMISATYQLLGQSANARKHRDLAVELRAKQPPATAK